MASNDYVENFSSIEGKAIIFYDARYNRAFMWWAQNEEETVEAIRAWAALQVPAVGLYVGCVDGELNVVPFDGHTADDLKQYMTVNEGWDIPPGMKGRWDDQTLYTKSTVNTDEWGM
jgi:hypothetical protein